MKCVLLLERRPKRRPQATAFFLAALACAATLPAAAQQTDLPGTTDPTGDVVWTLDGEDLAPRDDADHLDIVGVHWLSEDEGNLTLRLEVAGSPEGTTLQHLRGVEFLRGQQWYRVIPSVDALRCEEPGRGSLQVGDGERFSQVECVPEEESDGRSWTWTVPKRLLLDENEAPLVPGGSVEQTHATAYATPPRILPGLLGIHEGQVEARDRAPDQGFLAPLIASVAGGDGLSQLQLRTREAVRSTNGEQTTIVFDAVVMNEASGPRQITLRTEASDDWTVFVPPLVSLDADEEVVVPVVVQVPSAHRHGQTQNLTLHAESGAGDQAELVLAVHWLETPQPAGHHPTLFFKTEDQGARNPFSWLDADGSQDRSGMPAVAAQGSLTDAHWGFSMQPLLQVGLELLEGSGHARVLLEPPVPMEDAEVRMRVLYCDLRASTEAEGCADDKGVVLGEAVWQEDAMEGATSLEGELAMHADGTFPYSPSAGIGAVVMLSGTPTATVPVEGAEALLHPDGTDFTLPLGRYEDPVERDLASGAGVSLTRSTPFSLPVNPGEGVLHRFEVQGGQDVVLEVQGRDRAWARIVGPDRVSAEDGVSVDVAVEAPVDAAPGASAQMLLYARPHGASDDFAVVLFSAEVVDPTVLDAPHETADLAAPADASTNAPVLLPALLLALLLRRRR